MACRSRARLIGIYAITFYILWICFQTGFLTVFRKDDFLTDFRDEELPYGSRYKVFSELASARRLTTRSIARTFLSTCPRVAKRLLKDDRRDDVSILQTDTQLYSDSVEVVFHGVLAEVAGDERYCRLWKADDGIFSGLVIKADIDTTGQGVAGGITSFICGFPMDRHTDISHYMAALVPEPCAHPVHIISLQDAHRKDAVLNVTDLTDVIRQEAPPWRDKATFTFSNSSALDVTTHTCFRGHKTLVRYDVTKPAVDAGWTAIERRVSYIYSSHVDLRQKEGVTIKGFGIINRAVVLSRHSYQLYCQLLVAGGKTPYLAGADIIDILSGRRIEESIPKYRDVIFQCVFPDLTISDLVQPVISYVSEPCSRPSHFMHVVIPEVREVEDRAEFMVCLNGPINSGYDDYYRLVEWMELNTLLGADHFIMYNHESGNEVDRFLRYYQQQGQLTLHDWDIPEFINVTNNREVWYYGQRILINDCMYRYMYLSKHLVFEDFDEVIAPKAPATSWSTMLANSGCSASAYTMVINVLFRMDWSDDIKTKDIPIIHELNLISLLKTSRENKLYPMNKRGKYIIKPSDIDSLLVHRPFPRDLKNVGPCILPPDVGVLHHYRESFVDSRESEADSLRDRSLHQLAAALITRTQFTHSQVRRYA